jgi:hypothetical protein
MITNDLVENESRRLSQLTSQLRYTKKRHTAVTRKILSLQKESPNDDNILHQYQNSQDILAENRARLEDRIRSYPQTGDTRSRVLPKLANDLWDTIELPEKERRRRKKKFKDFALYGRKYSQLRPQGVILFMGNMPFQG